jgi:hypothetical protein
LRARGESPDLSRELRDAYWLAAASNVLAGAILYHLLQASPNAGLPDENRARAQRAAEDGLRVIRRADECWSDSTV